MILPSRLPKAAPVSNTANVWPVRGTGVNINGIDTRAIKDVNATKAKIRVNSLTKFQCVCKGGIIASTSEVVDNCEASLDPAP